MNSFIPMTNTCFNKYLWLPFWIAFSCCCQSTLFPASGLCSFETEVTEENQSCIPLRGIWKGVLYLVNHGRQQVIVSVSQDDCNISIHTSSTLPYGRFFRGHISSNKELIVYDAQTSECWTSFITQPTLTAFTIYDYVNNYSGLDKLQIVKQIDKGDVDNNYIIDLRDAILLAQIITNTATSSLYFVESDVNGDRKLGMAELVFILQELSQ